jgi:hypothetical protein
MGERPLIEQAIKTVPLAEFEVVFRGQKAKDGIYGQSGIAPDHEFRAVAGGKDQDFFDSFGLRQHGESLSLAASAHPEALPNFHRGRPVIQPDHHECRLQEARSAKQLGY